MGSRFRHYCALMKKNWIIWKRTLAASLCELFCPVILMAILAIARALIEIDNVDSRSNVWQTQLFAPADYLSNAADPLKAVNTQATAYSQFMTFSNINFTEKNPVMQFIPKGCLGKDADPARTVIAYSGPKALTDPIIKQIQDTNMAQKNILKLIQNSTDETASKIKRSIGEVAQLNFTYRAFNQWYDIKDYIKGDNYMTNNDNPGVCMGFSIQENSASDYEVRLMFSDRQEESRSQMIPSQLEPSNSEFDRDQDTTSFNMYTQQGYSLLHNWIANEVLQAKVNNQNAAIAMTLVPFKSDKYISDSYGLIMQGMLPFFMLLMYILPVYRLISNVVAEKESKARESMKMMGLTDSSYWLSWFSYYFLVVTIISVLCVIILSPTVFTNSDKGVIFLYFWVYGLSLFGFCLLLQAFFSRARVAAITGTLIYFGTSFVNAAVADSQVKQNQKNLASLLSTVAVQLGAQNLALFETNGMGLTYDNINTVYNNYRFSSCLILMAVSFLICLLLGLYLDNVLPSAYGLKKPWYFFCQSSYWVGTKSRARIHQRNHSDMEHNDDSFECQDMKRENFEPVQRELHQQESENKILKIAGLQKTYPNGFSAVKGLNIKMYNGQIFALLGHNGAGKTTTISMLTGLVNSTGGHCEVFGMDMFDDMSTVRQFLGVCPQHDVLFDLLSPEEHLDIFCDFKGVDRKAKKEEIKKMLVDVDIFHSKDIEAKKLSGGNRRKLSVAIALIGGSKLVLLDEPTAGMDLSARRKLWNMLKNYKNNRIIILTTHYMDEADILGDRIGIMTGGKLICLGSSLFLKNRFGVGYNFTMVKNNKEANTKVGPYLKEKIGEVKKLSEVSSEITYQIPTALSYKFKEFFNHFDNDLDRLDIRSYGISVTTLEEVFLKVGHGDDGHDDKQALEEIQNMKSQSQKNEEEDYSIAEDFETGAMNVFMINFKALFRKRMNIYKRNVKGLVTEIIIPVILVLIGFAFTKVQFFNDSPARYLTPNDFPLKQRMSMNGNILRGTGFTAQQFLQGLPQYQTAFDITVRNYTATNLVDNLLKFDDDVFMSRLNEPYEPYRYGSYFLFEADKPTHQYKVSTFINTTSQDVSAFFPQFMYESILKQATGNQNFKFQVITQSHPITLKLRQRAAQANGIFIVFVVSIGFALIPASIVSFTVNEREKNLKHMQLISGLDLSAYWISNLAFDLFKAIIPCVITIGLMYAFGLDYQLVWLLFLLFPIGIIPFSYVTSFLFSSENIAQTVTIFLHFVISGIGAIVASILRMISSTYAVGDALVWVFKIIPSYTLTDSIMYQATIPRLKLIRPELDKPYTDINAIGGDILLVCLHGIVWTIVLVLIETRAFRCLDGVFRSCRGKKISERTDLVLDEDVTEEEIRVASSHPDQIKVRVNKFRKVYTQAFRAPYLAVEKTSFGLDYGECFALLGVNGAGKTTTFKSLTGDIVPTSGEITINGMDIQRDFAKVRKLIGYCPQHDCIFDTMTVEEHLEYYAKIKGIRKNKIKQLVEKQIREMNLEEHRKKLAGALSGGNKRKLSVAMCVIGNPPIILLDEPSAGMDPEARRFMWSVVARISQHRKKSAVILTTHSMEEAEALSTKMGIMVKGGIFRCFGSSQHIKSKYGTGYEIEVKVRKLTPEDISIMAQNYGLGGMKTIHFDQVEPLLRSKMIDPFLINELRYGGLGNDLVCEADEHDGHIECHNLLNWIYVEQAGMRIINGLCDDFGQVEILEHYNDYYKMRVPRGSKSIGFVFSLIENKREEYKISEYSASQTTLEQIFQTFANLKLDDKDLLKFHKVNGMVKQITMKDSSYVNLENAKAPPTLNQENQKSSKGGKGMTNF